MTEQEKPAEKAAAKKSAPKYVVTAALAICYVEGQGQVYAYRGATVPAGTSEDHIKHLLESNIIAPVED